MKKIVSPIPNGGYPFTDDAFLVAHDGLYDTIQTLYGSIAPTWVVIGAEVVQIASGNTCTVASGYVFLGNELRFLPAATTPFPAYIVAASDSYEQDLYGNSALQNVYVTKSATITTVKPLTAPYLLIDPTVTGGDDTVTKRLRPLITGALGTSLAQEILDRKDGDDKLRQAILNEAQTRLTADNLLQSNIDSLTAVVNTKQNRVSTRIPWQDIPITNTYYGTVGDPNDPYWVSTLGSNYNKFQAMRTEDGIVHLRGYLRGNGAGTVTSTLPQEFRPKATVQHNVTYITAGNNAYPGKVTTIHSLYIDPYGVIYNEQYMSQFVNSTGDPLALQLFGFHPWMTCDGFSYSVE